MFDLQEVFDSLPEKTMEAWGTLIGGPVREGTVSNFLHCLTG